MGVARHWGLPDALQRCMRRPDAASPAQPMAHGPERLRWMSVAANELSDAVWQGDEQTLPRRLEAVAQRHGRALGFGLPDLRRAVDAARGALAEMAPAMGLSLPKDSRAQQVLAQAPEPVRDMADSLLPHQLAATLPLVAGADAAYAATHAAIHAATVLMPSAAAPELDGLSSTVLVAATAASAAAVAERSAVADVLAAGIQDITDTLSGDSFRLNEVLRMVLETMYRALGFQRMVFCLRDPATGRLNGRFGLGDQAATMSPVFQVPLRWPAGQPPDLFGAVCLKGSDTLIADSQAPAIAQRLPAWYRQQVNAPMFLLLPMMMKGAPFALIYADQARSGGLAVGDRELALMRTLRNQAVMAFRQVSQAG